MNHFSKITVVLLFFILSCKKDDVALEANLSQSHEDASNIKSESDNTNSDINFVLSEVSGFKKKDDVLGQGICGATIDSSHAKDAIPTLYINFNGTTTCLSPARIRSGQIKIELIKGKTWSEKGAILNITHVNYKVKFVGLNNRSFTINGLKKLTNIDGFSWWELYTKGTLSIRYKERADNLSILFEDESKGTWNIAREIKLEYTYSSNSLKVIIDGDSTSGTNKIDSWGTNRFNENFTTRVTEAWESNSTCGGWKPIKGKYIHETPSFTLNVLFGTDKSGNRVNSGCATSFVLDWVLNTTKKSGTSIIDYW